MVYKTFSAYDIAISEVVIIMVIRLIISAYNRQIFIGSRLSLLAKQVRYCGLEHMQGRI